MVRIKDVAKELGVSPTTVSNVIHGKKKRVSPEMVKKIEAVLERENYVPNMAGVLLAQSSSKIIAVVFCNKIKYGDKMLQDPFISEMMAGLGESIREKGYFTMLHNTSDFNEVIRMSAMWNVAGLLLFGFRKEDYDILREKLKVPFVTCDGYFDTDINGFVNVGTDDFGGGYRMTKYLLEMGHKNIIYVADDHIGCEMARLKGVKAALGEVGIDFDIDSMPILSSDEKERQQQMEDMAKAIADGTNDYSAIFFAADKYAVQAMSIFQDEGLSIPDQISIVGFDDVNYASVVRPYLTTVRQDILLKAVVMVNTIMNMINGHELPANDMKLPVEVMIRKSVRDINKDR